jgi:hypothetical protein
MRDLGKQNCNLNERSIATPRGGAWTARSVLTVVARLAVGRRLSQFPPDTQKVPHWGTQIWPR